MPLIGEADGDPVLAPGPDLLDETVVELLRPFPLQELDDRGTSLHELGTVPPPAILGIDAGDAHGIAAIPAILRAADLLDGGFERERGQRRAGIGQDRKSVV